MDTNANKGEDLLGRLEEDINSMGAVDENGAPQPEPTKKKKVASVKIGDEDVPVNEIPNVITKLQEQNANQLEAFNQLKEGMAKALGKEDNGDQADELDDVEFLSNKKYRTEYINKMVDKLVEDKIKDLKSATERTNQQLGQMKYDSIKTVLNKSLRKQGMKFDFDQNDEQINKIVTGTFGIDYIRKNPVKVISYAVQEMLKSNNEGADLTLPSEMPSGTSPSGKTKTTADDIRSQIKGAKPPGQENIPDGNPFGLN